MENWGLPAMLIRVGRIWETTNSNFGPRQNILKDLFKTWEASHTKFVHVIQGAFFVNLSQRWEPIRYWRHKTALLNFFILYRLIVTQGVRILPTQIDRYYLNSILWNMRKKCDFVDLKKWIKNVSYSVAVRSRRYRQRIQFTKRPHWSQHCTMSYLLGQSSRNKTRNRLIKLKFDHCCTI